VLELFARNTWTIMTGIPVPTNKETPMLTAAIVGAIIIGSAARGWAKIERAKHGVR
jgi:hypothetical protein